MLVPHWDYALLISIHNSEVPVHYNTHLRRCTIQALGPEMIMVGALYGDDEIQQCWLANKMLTWISDMIREVTMCPSARSIVI